MLDTAEGHSSTDPLILYRIWPEHWLTDAALEKLLSFFAGAKRSVDELIFFNECYHAPMRLDRERARMERLRRAMALARQQLGVRAGINILATIGHREEGASGSLPENWARIVGADGAICQSAACPADLYFLDYVAALYSAAAAARPDVIWLDDDFRLQYHEPVTLACYCSGCLKEFGRRVGGSYARQELLNAWNDASPDAPRLRRAWLQFNRDRLRRVMQTAERAVHAVDPHLPIGLMTGEFVYDGYGYREHARTLTGPTGARVLWRPGAGFWNDNGPREVISKAHSIGRQVAGLPEWVTAVQGEIENIPYQKLLKSVHMTMVECAVDLAVGCTGIQHNVLPYREQPEEEHRPFLEQTARNRSFFERIRRAAGRAAVAGIYPAWTDDLFLAQGHAKDWFAPQGGIVSLRAQQVLGEIGLPIAYSPAARCATTLAGPLPALFSSGALTEFLRGGVFMDAEACRQLHERGLGHLTGVTRLEPVERDVLERLSEHPLNGNGQGLTRDARPAFFSHEPERSYRLEPMPGASVLAQIENYEGEDRGSCLTLFENALGGRVAVCGYSPWAFIHSLIKVRQLRAVFLWLARGDLPAMVESYGRVHVWARARGDGKRCFFLLNASQDAVPGVTLRLASSGRFDLMTPNGEEAKAASASAAGAGHCLDVGGLGPWACCFISEEGSCD